jgi:hypothetical protein
LAPDESKLNSWILYISYCTDLVIASEEYYIYSLNTLIASIGGGLGMFLGVSIFGTLSRLLRHCIEKITVAQQAEENNLN